MKLLEKPAQSKAISRFKKFLEREIEREAELYGAKITEWDVEATDHGTFWIKAQTEYTALPENNVLRALSHEFWHVSVGKRGSLTAWTYPKSLKQFKGKSFLGVNIK